MNEVIAWGLGGSSVSYMVVYGARLTWLVYRGKQRFPEVLK